MRQWKSLVPSLQLHAPSSAPPPPCSPPSAPPPRDQEEEPAVVRLVGCDGRVRSYAPPVTARELMQQHPRHLLCRADALLIGERIPAVGAAEELQPGQAYFLLPAHLFRSVLSFVSLASSLLLLLAATDATAKQGQGGKAAARPFELHRTPAGALQIKFSDDFLLAGPPEKETPKGPAAPPPPLSLDGRLAKEYEDLVGYAKSRRWAPKLETIQEVVVVVPPAPAAASSQRRSKSRAALPFLGRLGSRRLRRGADDACSAVACSG